MINSKETQDKSEPDIKKERKYNPRRQTKTGNRKEEIYNTFYNLSNFTFALVYVYVNVT